VSPATTPAPISSPPGLRFAVQGRDWEYHEKAYVLLHKPAGYECSAKPSTWPSVYTLLPAPLRQRPQKQAMTGVQAVGRLDQDTTGMLLLSDDGVFIHRMSSPRHHVPKVYEVEAKHAVTQAMVDRLLAGVVLDDDPAPVRAAACEIVGETGLRLTLTEGKYHQVKRMVAAVGNRVEKLHRSRIGGLDLGGLASGPVALALAGRPGAAAAGQASPASNSVMAASAAAGWSRCGEWPQAGIARQLNGPAVGPISRTWRSVPYGSSSPCNASTGAVIRRQSGRMSNARKPSLNQMSFHCQNAPSTSSW
jgi:16S rRNA pseudouridine516 synthase